MWYAVKPERDTARADPRIVNAINGLVNMNGTHNEHYGKSARSSYAMDRCRAMTSARALSGNEFRENGLRRPTPTFA